MKKLSFTILTSALLLCAAGTVTAATWTPIGSGAGRPKSLELSTNTTFAIPAGIAARGGNIHVTIIGGGEGGHSSKASCDDYAIQGGKGGDGGEVIEIDVDMQPGQCSAGLAISIGLGGRGAFRSGNNAAAGESGGQTGIACSGVSFASALGGGRRSDAYTAPRAAKGGAGGVVMNTLDQASSTQPVIDQRSTAITTGIEGQSGRGGYGSGGGGGGASLALSGSAVKADGTVMRRTTTRNAPMGKGGYGAGTGAGPAEYTSEANAFPAENAVQFGSGGGGGAAMCGSSSAGRDGGNGAQGLVRIQWAD